MAALTMPGPVLAVEGGPPALTGELAFARLTDGYWQIWIRTLETGAERQLTHSAEDKRTPVWDAEGALYFRAANDQVQRWDPETGELGPALEPVWPVLDVAVAATGSMAVIQAHHGMQNATTLMLLDATGRPERPLTSGIGFRAHPAWSPDGRSVAFVHSRSTSDLDIRVASITEGTIEDLIVAPGQNLRPAYAPDGSRIAYASDRSGDFEIWLWDASEHSRGQPGVQLTDSEGLDTSPTWSADGRHLAFTSRRTRTLEIWVMAPDGTDQRPLVDSAPSMDPAWR